MGKNYNSEAFTPDEVASGAFANLLNYLISFNVASKDSYYDIHITSDSYCSIIEWHKLFFNDDSDSKFKFVNYDEAILKEVIFPDNHVEYLAEDEVNNRFSDWVKENPSWHQDNYGHWYNEDEIEMLQNELNIDNADLQNAPVQDSTDENVDNSDQENDVSKICNYKENDVSKICN